LTAVAETKCYSPPRNAGRSDRCWAGLDWAGLEEPPLLKRIRSGDVCNYLTVLLQIKERTKCILLPKVCSYGTAGYTYGMEGRERIVCRALYH